MKKSLGYKVIQWVLCYICVYLFFIASLVLGYAFACFLTWDIIEFFPGAVLRIAALLAMLVTVLAPWDKVLKDKGEAEEEKKNEAGN